MNPSRHSHAVQLYLLLFCITSLVESDGSDCDPKCSDFTFCTIDDPGSSSNPKDDLPILLHAPEKASYPFICKKDVVKGKGFSTDHIRITEIGEAQVSQVNQNADPIRISAWQPIASPAPRPRFPKNYFGVFAIPLSFGMQGVGRIQSKGNQESLLNDLCVRIPINEYQRVTAMGSPIGPKIGTKLGACVSFRTTVPEVVADFYWKAPQEADFIEVDLFLCDSKGQVAAVGTRQKGKSTRCIGCQTWYWLKPLPGTYRICYRVSTRSALLSRHMIVNGRSHDCPGRFHPSRQLLTSRTRSTTIAASLSLTVNGRQRLKGPVTSSQGFPVTVQENKSTTGSFGRKFTIRPAPIPTKPNPSKRPVPTSGRRISCICRDDKSCVCNDILCECDVPLCDCKKRRCKCPQEACRCILKT